MNNVTLEESFEFLNNFLVSREKFFEKYKSEKEYNGTEIDLQRYDHFTNVLVQAMICINTVRVFQERCPEEPDKFIDGAIDHCKDVIANLPVGCGCANDHERLKGYLEELKFYRGILTSMKKI